MIRGNLYIDRLPAGSTTDTTSDGAVASILGVDRNAVLFADR